MRYIRIRNVAGVLVIATPLAMESKGGGSAADGGRISVHDLIADNVHEKDYKGGGAFLKYASAKVAVHDVQIDHVTSIGPGPLLAILSRGEPLLELNYLWSVSPEGRPRFALGNQHRNCSPCYFATIAQLAPFRPLLR
jgi:hypothetical protein